MSRKRRHPVDSDECWPEISLLDLRKAETRRTRPFGEAKWRPIGPDNLRIAEMVLKVRDAERAMAQRDGREWRGIGSRQYAYRLKTRGFMFADGRVLDKDDFPRVERIVGRLRRDPDWSLDWEDVSDGRGIFHEPLAFRNNRERAETLPEWAADMTHDRMEKQKIVPELAVETVGLYNLFYDIADRFGARANGLQGQSSIGARRDLAERVAWRWRQRVRTRVLCVADFDKHGDHILAAVAADAAEHLRDMGLSVDGERILQVNIVALTQRQIIEHDIPVVEKDGRSVQEAEALPTDVLRREVEAALRTTLNMKLFERIARKKQPEIDAFVQKVRRALRPPKFGN
jgi:hypothetical protein